MASGSQRPTERTRICIKSHEVAGTSDYVQDDGFVVKNLSYPRTFESGNIVSILYIHIFLATVLE